jgi:hypothetical protein
MHFGMQCQDSRDATAPAPKVLDPLVGTCIFHAASTENRALGKVHTAYMGEEWKNRQLGGSDSSCIQEDPYYLTECITEYTPMPGNVARTPHAHSALYTRIKECQNNGNYKSY